MHLEQANAARADKTLNTVINWPEWGLLTYRQVIEQGKFVGKRITIENSVRFNRSKFNQMTDRDQIEYNKRLNVTKQVYCLYTSETHNFDVPKVVYEYANGLPEWETKDYSTKY